MSSRQLAYLEVHPHSNLRGEGNTYRGARPEKVSESAGRIEKLLVADNGHATGGRADLRGVVEAVHRIGQRRNVGDVVVARVRSVEQVEELDERLNVPMLAQLKGPRNFQVDLHVRCAAKLIERCLYAVDDGAILGVVACAVDVDRRGKREWPRAFELHQGRELQLPGNIENAHQHKAIANVLTGRSVVARAEGIQRITNAVNVVEEFTHGAAPGLGAGQGIVGHKMEPGREI